MTPRIHFDDFLSAFEQRLEGIFLSMSNSSSSSSETSQIDHSEIENAIKELGKVLDEHLPLQIAAISGGEVNLTEDQIARLKYNLIRLEKIEIMAQSRLAWVNSLGKEMAEWVDKLDVQRQD